MTTGIDQFKGSQQTRVNSEYKRGPVDKPNAGNRCNDTGKTEKAQPICADKNPRNTQAEGYPQQFVKMESMYQDNSHRPIPITLKDTENL